MASAIAHFDLARRAWERFPYTPRERDRKYRDGENTQYSAQNVTISTVAYIATRNYEWLTGHSVKR